MKKQVLKPLWLQCLRELFEEAEDDGKREIEISALDVQHKGKDKATGLDLNRFSSICSAMCFIKESRDIENNKGKDTSTFRIKYFLPRLNQPKIENIDILKQGNNFLDQKNYGMHKGANTMYRKTATLDIGKAIAAIEKYHNTPTVGKLTRFLSWNHLYQAFKENRSRPDKIDYLCLHLAWYLASWGMLRGNKSGLMGYDYKVHVSLVKFLSEEHFYPLYQTTCDDPKLNLISEVAQKIWSLYPEKISNTDTLKTKILLGVFGCVPAYDKYFKATAKKYGICGQTFTSSSLTKLWDYYNKHKEFEDLRQKLKFGDGLLYPPMKLMDMCLWQIGMDEDTNSVENQWKN